MYNTCMHNVVYTADMHMHGLNTENTETWVCTFYHIVRVVVIDILWT